MQHAAQNLDGAAARYRGLKVPVTGGLGFIGSNLALRLVDLGAQVTVVDPSVADCGANPHNLSAAPGVRVIAEDIANAAAFAGEIRGSGVIFNLAGEISHIHSMQWPARDAALNATGQLKFIGECARQAPGVRIVYASTRQIYGAPEYLPVDEDHRVRPVDFNGIHKYAATQYHLMYSALGMIDATVLCLTNVHGPRMALHIPCQGLLGNFIRRALYRMPIEIFGDGRQLRDPVFVDDVVDAFLLAGTAKSTGGRLWNLGGPEALPLARIAETFSAATGAPAPVFRRFSGRPQANRYRRVRQFLGAPARRARMAAADVFRRRDQPFDRLLSPRILPLPGAGRRAAQVRAGSA